MKKIFIAIFALLLSVNLAFADKIEYENPKAGIYIFKIDTKKYGEKIKPYMADRLMTAQKVYDDMGLDLAVNGGYFDAKDGRSVSYVVINGIKFSDVEDDIILSENLKKEDRLDKVISRGEFRILENGNGKLKFDIARHNTPVEHGYKIKHALQAGPIVYPDMDLIGEGFVKYKDDEVIFQAVDILKKRERTLIGLKGKWLYIVLFTKDYMVDANEMKDYAKHLRLKKAIGFDGGLSTSISCKDTSIGTLGKYQRRVKSFLIIER